MNTTVASVWSAVPDDVEACLTRCIHMAMENSQRSPQLFFRADDVAVPSHNFARMVALFSQHEIPLAMAVVPAWLTAKRWEVLRHLTQAKPGLWCWHQHGWRHTNHEPSGKKMEFGPSRSLDNLTRDLNNGRRQLESILGADFFPAFTPPWNRCDQRTVDLLVQYQYQVISRDRHAFAVPQSKAMAAINVNLDLHTRKDPDAASGWQHLLHELYQGLMEGFCGIMLHHQRMNQAAFDFLDLLLGRVRAFKALQPTRLDAWMGNVAEFTPGNDIE